MKTPHVVLGAMMLAAAAAACNRAETDEAARRTAGEVRDAAAVAGDRLADGWLSTKVQAQYFADEDVKARFINVSADEGIVTLRGRVDSEAAREQAVQIARNTDGVRQVRDLLLVGPPPDPKSAPHDAGWITTQIQARYFADTVIDGSDIDVATQNGVVTLSGRVGSEQEKTHAVEIARGIDGVIRVDDRLVVDSRASGGAVATSGTAATPAPVVPVDDSRVATSIRAKYFLDNTLKSRRIEVDAQQGVVTLRGEVASDTERAQALLLARTTEGATRVEDHLTVSASLEPIAGRPAPAAGAAPSAAPSAASSGATSAAPPAAPSRAAQAQDATLTKSVQSRLAADRQARAATIEVTAKDGVVLLDGTAPSAAAKQRAVTIARETQGVVQVIDRLRVGRSR